MLQSFGSVSADGTLPRGPSPNTCSLAQQKPPTKAPERQPRLSITLGLLTASLAFPSSLQNIPSPCKARICCSVLIHAKAPAPLGKTSFQAMPLEKGLCHLQWNYPEMWGNGQAFIYVDHCLLRIYRCSNNGGINKGKSAGW